MAKELGDFISEKLKMTPEGDPDQEFWMQEWFRVQNQIQPEMYFTELDFWRARVVMRDWVFNSGRQGTHEWNIFSRVGNGLDCKFTLQSKPINFAGYETWESTKWVSLRVKKETITAYDDPILDFTIKRIQTVEYGGIGRSAYMKFTFGEKPDVYGHYDTYTISNGGLTHSIFGNRVHSELTLPLL